MDKDNYNENNLLKKILDNNHNNNHYDKILV